MTKLECHVTNCASNADDCCCRPDIQVDGACACGCEETCCASFQEKKESYGNAIRHDVPNDALRIGCNAVNCVHNAAGECDADCICVEGCGAGCKSQTECATFCCR